jgi:thioesterase domain-containing protein
MAQQLRRQGEDVARLFILDTYLADEAASRIAEAGVLVRRAVRIGPAALTRRILRRRPADHGEQARTAHAYRAQARYREWARERYQPEPFPGDAVLLRATGPAAGGLGRRQDALLGWGDIVTGTLAVHDVRTDHVGLVREPAVAVLADHVRAHLRGLD